SRVRGRLHRSRSALPRTRGARHGGQLRWIHRDMPLSSSAPPAPKRHLTVLNNKEANADPTGDGSAPRRPWQWVGFGALAIFTAWIPLAGLAAAAAARLGESTFAGAGIGIVTVYAAALALGAALGGVLVGRWGAAGGGLRGAALAGPRGPGGAGGLPGGPLGPR